ncbi:MULTISPECIES: AfsR/SARP family transcriptional regulator [unclassified Streptomyces]|uniref:AfsR/SARP family transcriptional regulator n=1 Tax=unclassified Streptomyces TaxID=2593676 RepID=UPI0011A0F89C|nr:AfsR/SARP family transcriptional regulator [Streptomyces sp. BK340]TVZ81353.1 DNA-binding SARP family transcriptional activator [Streptomyces sp. BK340]
MLKFSILGALQIRTVSGPAEISGDLQRTLVQTLLISEGQSVSGESLVEEMWGDAVPDNQANALQAHVSRLRRRLRSLEPGRSGSRVTIHPSGYRLVVSEGELDAAEFVRTVRQAESASPQDAERTARLLGDALAQWRGPVFGGFAGGTLCQLAGARYEEYRMRAMELRFDAELRLGRHAAVLAELTEAHTNHPLRERFCEQLMIALYGSGRQADALDVFRRMRRHLDDELGIQPSPALRHVESAILRHDPALAGDARSSLLQLA